MPDRLFLNRRIVNEAGLPAKKICNNIGLGQEGVEAGMRRIEGLKFAAAFLALMAGSLPAQADDDRYYNLINASTTRVDFGDQNAKRRPDGAMVFSILTVFASGPVAYAFSQVSLNCASQQIATLANETHAEGGAIIPHDAVDTTPQAIATGTLGQSLKVVVCDGADPYPRSKLIKGTQNAISKAHDLIATSQKNQ